MDIQAINREILAETAKSAFTGAAEKQQKKMASEQAETKSSPEGKIPDRQEAKQMVGQLNELMSMFDKSVRFMVEDGENNFRVAIVDRKTDQVLKEFPPENLVNVVNRIRDAVGVIIDEKI